jgi:Protein of unknown function (DUF4242)
MPSYMDVHDIPGVTAEDVAKAHEADVRVQGQYGVNYKQYWVDEADGKVFCLVDAPDKETATRVHREAQRVGGPHSLRGRGRRRVEADHKRPRLTSTGCSPSWPVFRASAAGGGGRAFSRPVLR